jgi:hypothetical protein
LKRKATQTPEEMTMKYLMLCQIQPAAFAHVSAEDGRHMMDAMMAYNRQLTQAGVLLSAGQLALPDTAQKVFAQQGHIKTQVGPALAGDTQIGGFYVIDVPGEAEATGWAAKCPIAQFGAVEIREIIFSPA